MLDSFTYIVCNECFNYLCAGLDVLMFQEQYLEVVRTQANIELKITKCTTIGPPRTGKTCLKNLIIGREWDVKAGTASTDVMEAPEWVECYSVEEGGAEDLWKLLSRNQKNSELLRAVVDPTTSNTKQTPTPMPSETSPTPPSEAQPTPSSNVSATPTNVQHPTTPNDTELPSPAPPLTTSPEAAQKSRTVRHALEALVSKEQQKGELIQADNELTINSTQLTTKPSDMTSHTDVAATPSKVEHRTTPSGTESRIMSASAHPPTFKRDTAQKSATVQQALEALAGACSSEALQDILKDKQGRVLGKRRLIHFIDTGGQRIYHDIHPVLITSPSIYLVVFSLKDFKEKNSVGLQSYFRSDLIQRPLRSIYTFGTKIPKVKGCLEVLPEAPKIFIVGTHLDQIPLDGQDPFLETMHKVIEKEINDKPYRQFVQYDVKGRSFWAVDNTLAGREQDDDTKEYISTLCRMVQDKSMEMPVKVPLPWMLLQMVMDGKEIRYCKYSELLKEALNLGYVREGSPEADLDIMLKVFSALGLIYHKVPSECKKEDGLVFIDPGCLYSATSDFLMAAKEEIEDSSETQHQIQAASMEKTDDNQGGSEEVQHQTQAASTEKAEDNQGGSEEGQHQTQAVSTEETEDNQGGSEEGQRQTQAVSTEKAEDNQGGSEEGQRQTQAVSSEKTEDNQGGSEEGQHQTQAASREEPKDNHGNDHEEKLHNVDLARNGMPVLQLANSFDKRKCHEALHPGQLAYRERDSTASQKLTQSAPVQKDLRGGVRSLKVFERVSNSVKEFLFDMHTVLHSMERIVMKVGMEPLDIVSQNLLRIQQGVEDKCCSDDANTLQSKYRILAREMVWKLMNSVRKVLQSSASEDKKPKLDSIMRDFWCQCRMTRSSIEKDDFNHLLLLLEELRIIAKLKQPDCYLIPAALPQRHDQITPVAEGIEPLLFTVISQDHWTYFLPSGLFCCLINDLVTELGCTVIPLGRTHVAFTHEVLTKKEKVHITECESYIEITLESAVNPQVKGLCNTLRQRIHEGINCMYSMIYDQPESQGAVVVPPESRSAVVAGFKCNCGRDEPQTPHFSAYEEDEFESCLRCLLPKPMPTELYPLTEEHLVWFS